MDVYASIHSFYIKLSQLRIDKLVETRTVIHVISSFLEYRKYFDVFSEKKKLLLKINIGILQIKRYKLNYCHIYQLYILYRMVWYIS